MTKIKDLIPACNTGLAAGLSSQIIAQMNAIVPNILVNFDDLKNLELSPGPHVNPYVQSAAKETLRLAIRDNGGVPLRVNSAYRTIVQQYLLYQQYRGGLCGIGIAASPGRSNHEDGLALDILNYDQWIEPLERYSWGWFGPGDEVHFTYLGASVRDDIGAIGIQAFQQLWNQFNPNDPISADGVFGFQTQARLNESPAEGFGGLRLLKFMERPIQGEDVTKVQKALVIAGFLKEDQVDGIYGSGTKEAVKNFQKQNGLSVDGIVGRSTRRRLGIS